MASVNKVILVGNLGQDPEVRYTPAGAAVCTFSIATSESWTDKNSGQKQSKTEWHRIVAWNKLAEICGEYLHKGKQVYVEGKLETRKWQDKDNIDRYTTEVKIHTMQMLGNRNDGGQQGGQQNNQQGGYQGGGGFRQPQQGGGGQGGPNQGYGGGYPGDDDIPF